MPSQSTTDADFAAPLYGFPIRRFTIPEYHRLADAGILTDDDRVELLEGFISPKMVHSPIHDATVSSIEYLIRPLLLQGWILRIQSAVSLTTSEPEPDVVIALGPPARYAERHPTGMDIAMVIEIAETSLLRDRRKAVIYASGEVPIYWIVNLSGRSLEVFDMPTKGVYERCRIFTLTEKLELNLGCMTCDSICVSDLFVT